MKKRTSVKDVTIMNKTSEDDVTTMKKKTKTEVTVAIESSFTDLKSRRTLISAAPAAASPCSEGAAIVRKRRSGTSSVDDCLSQGMQEYKNLRQQKIANACAFRLHQCHESPSTLQTCYAKTSTPPSHRLHLHIVARVKMSPRSSIKGTRQNQSKLWQLPVNSKQSSLLVKLKKRMLERKLKLKRFTTNHLFDNVFAVPEDEEETRYEPLQDSIMAASKEELVAREVIAKTAHKLFRKQQGVWSQLGKPYECLGIPDDVRLSNLQHPRSEEPPKDKGNHGSRAHNSFQEKQPGHSGSKWVKKGDLDLKSVPETISCIPQSRRRKELLQNYANASSQMSRMLMKMGLVDFHDSNHVRFPRSSIVVAESIRKSIKEGGAFPEELASGMMASNARELSQMPLEGEQFILGMHGEAIQFLANGDGSAPSPLLNKDVNFSPVLENRPQTPTTCTLSSSNYKVARHQPHLDDNLVFGWKKRILTLRKSLEKDLHLQLVERSDRRERWRSCSPFSAEVANKMMERLDKFGGRQSPSNNSDIWKSADVHHKMLPQKQVQIETQINSIQRFYDRVCTFTSHLPRADPLMDVFIEFMKNHLEEGGVMNPNMLLSLCKSLARLPEHVVNLGHITSVFPILQFIGKELHVTSIIFNKIMQDSGLTRSNIDV
ncbi:unnamed protein product [Sphagnum tenellum]